jgi:hypothetical protein
MKNKYKNYPGMKMIKRATGSSKVESTMYKAGQTMRNILDKGLLSVIKKSKLSKEMGQSVSKPFAIANQKPAKPTKAGDIFKKMKFPKGMEQSASKPSAFANQKFATKTKQAGDIFKKIASSKVAKIVKFARMATPIGAALTIASGFGTYEKGKSPQELAEKAYEKGKKYKVADEFTVVGSEGTKKVKMKSKGGIIIGKQADYIKDLI